MILFTIFTYVCILLGVAFYTLMERKGLGYIQTRKGPNKVGIVGILQPLADAAKLFTKEYMVPVKANSAPFLTAPMLGLFLSLLMWSLYPSSWSFMFFKFGLMFLLCVMSFNVYSVLAAGWTSNSKYAFLGALRAAAQTISYEVSLVFIMLFPIFFSFQLSFDSCSSQMFWSFLLLAPICFIWVASCLAETNRAPFDFAEGESELVSGFNIEFASGGFALIFMAEYANILMMSMITAALFFGQVYPFHSNSWLWLATKAFILSFLFIWVRGAYPRFRYDLLMDLTWKGFLPVILSCLGLLILLPLAA